MKVLNVTQNCNFATGMSGVRGLVVQFWRVTYFEVSLSGRISKNPREYSKVRTKYQFFLGIALP